MEGIIIFLLCVIVVMVCLYVVEHTRCGYEIPAIIIACAGLLGFLALVYGICYELGVQM